LKSIVETGEDMEKSLITPSLEQLRESNTRLFANAAA
jgi:hypothetical protein